MSMKLTRKAEAPDPANAEAVAAVPAMPWDHAMKLLGTGDYDVLGFPRGERGPDQPGAQSPAPGVDQVDGRKEKAEDGQTLTNMTSVAAPAVVNGGLPKAPAPMQPNDAAAPKGTPTVKPADPAAPIKA